MKRFKGLKIDFWYKVTVELLKSAFDICLNQGGLIRPIRAVGGSGNVGGTV